MSKMTCCAALIDPLYACTCSQYQLTYKVEDADVLHNAIKLAFSYPFCLSSTQLCLNAAWKNWVGVRLYSIVRMFF
jgi:hypothetical protein